MPCHNAAATLDESIASILAQTLQSFELVAVDDGSQDDTLHRLHAWAKRDPRVLPVSRSHTGLVETLNAGLAHCHASLIARMDADDRSHTDRLEQQVSFLGEHPDIAAVSCLVEGFPSHRVREGLRIYLQWLNSLVEPDEIARDIYIESPIAHPTAVVRRGWFRKLGGYEDHGWPEDYDLWLRMHLEGARFAKVPRVLHEWREREDRLTRTDPRYSVENFLRAKAFYLWRGPLQHRDAVILWGAGQMGRRLSKHLLRQGAPLRAFVDIDPKKIGRTRRGRPIIAPEDLPTWMRRYQRPVVLAVVGSRGARALIREQLNGMGYQETVDYWAVA